MHGSVDPRRPKEGEELLSTRCRKYIPEWLIPICRMSFNLDSMTAVPTAVTAKLQTLERFQVKEKVSTRIRFA